MKKPGALLASGRDSDIFEYCTTSVLRRSRAGHSMVVEARTMEYARAHRYPAPAVEEMSDDGTAMVMERLEGPSMVGAMSRRPWTVRQQGSALAELHCRLHEIPSPDWLPSAPFGDGDRLLHLDLHPLNVIITAKGPVVIDWPNAAKGDGAADVALSWILMAAGEIPSGRVKGALLRRVRGMLINSFLRDFDRAGLGPHLADVVEWKLKDPHMSATERQAMRLVASAWRAA